MTENWILVLKPNGPHSESIIGGYVSQEVACRAGLAAIGLGELLSRDEYIQIQIEEYHQSGRRKQEEFDLSRYFGGNYDETARMANGNIYHWYKIASQYLFQRIHRNEDFLSFTVVPGNLPNQAAA